MAQRAKRRSTAWVLLLVLSSVIAFVGCGGDAPDEVPGPSTAPQATVTSTTLEASAPTTTTRSGGGAVTTRSSGGAASCASLAAKAVDLLERWRNDMRGIAGPQHEAEHRAEARALAAEARRLGCPVPPGAEQIIDG